ncbi:hypothetical protein RclHR1_14440006 [Rhizophagus clarus]|uniref:Uncharacterized protein n=1 Tax=Rhizophagus clarus TaxID=94130 RepID=A0A2Z6QCS3_9GLOM|nr:hypothetical protein RclHR1_14440006 [Rhizophagus clarus]
MFTKIRNTIPCDCKKCDGKQVEERTKKSHMELEQRLTYSVSSFVPSLPENKFNNQAHTALKIDHHSLIAERLSSSKKRTEQGLIDDDMFLNDHETPVEQFVAPENDLEFKYLNTNVNFTDSWILIWIFKYQARFHLSDVAIDSLIKFFWQTLMDTDQIRFKDFPFSLHSASNLLQIDNQSKTYAVCPSCNTLYNIADVVMKEEFKCTHIEFSIKSKEKPCETELAEQVPLTIENKRRPKLLFLLLNLKIQINSLYQ